MTLTSAIYSGMSGIHTAETRLSIVSQNLTNEQNPDYDRLRVRQKSLVLGGKGAGVSATPPERIIDEARIKTIRSSTSSSSCLEVQSSYLSSLQEKFGTPGDGRALSDLVTELKTKLSALSTNSSRPSAQRDVIKTAKALAESIQALSKHIQEARAKADTEILSSVTAVNRELETIKILNLEISRARLSGGGSGVLESQREAAIQRLSKHIDVDVHELTSGAIDISLKSGKILLQGDVRPLSYSPAGSFAPDMLVENDDLPPILLSGDDITDVMIGGRIKGFLEVRDGFPKMQEALDRFTEKLRDTVNEAHNAGTPHPPQRTLTGTRTFADTNAAVFNGHGRIRIAVVDKTNPDRLTFAHAHDIDLGGINYNGLDLDTVRAQLNLLAGLDANFVDGKLQLQATNANHGIAIAHLDPDVSCDIDGGTAMGFSQLFGLNDFFTTGDNFTGDDTLGIAQKLEVCNDLLSQPSLLARGTLNTTEPLAGGEEALASGDGRNAKSIADILSTSHAFVAAGNMGATTESLIDYATSFIKHVSGESAHMSQQAKAQKNSLDFHISKAREISGVNRQEELAEMIMIEQSYNACAKVVMTASRMMDRLMEI